MSQAAERDDLSAACCYAKCMKILIAVVAIAVPAVALARDTDAIVVTGRADRR
jgi:hypothetical protein